ncbi:N-6 DNA methylase [Streptococcus sp. DD04]|uniref:N-6 DNA methylase n=1 Tax=Streptococcus sp. DD04 TaxID=1776578 RepID=UPI0007845081|nr:N-6 DNA methylase [Streptococcus sp. DD04]KXT63944.1 Type I restriction-modification system, DNA-methyltransferase subunit M [Streptococcus sp. DD04]
MSLKEYILQNVKNYNSTVKSEEDLKIKVILPYLKSLDYSEEDMRFESPMEVVIGSKKTTVYSDIEIVLDGRVELVIDIKKPSHSISQTDILQAASYAKLISTPPATMSCVTNGVNSVSTNTFTGEQEVDIPSKSQLMKRVNSTKRKAFNEVQLDEVKSILLTLAEPDELYKLISISKDIIEKKALIRSDQSFKEITKIILVKMNEERRVKAEEGNNRFSKKYLETVAKANSITIVESFKKLLEDALEKYPNIYPGDEAEFQVEDDEALLKVVDDLSPFSFLGTGEDIKGAVYEIFLKGTLRGEFDQYFTPREIVDFMVQLADPQMDDVFIDPACGSGGFLIQAFNHVNQKITSSTFSEVERKKKFKNLIDKNIWGHEADKDLHVLAKINLIMHGDGWNNIYQGDTLISKNLPNSYFDLVLANPPFTIKYEFPEVLSNFDLGLSKEKEELDILFVEKSLNLLKEGGELYIVLPEGLLTNKSYQYFRDWLLDKADLLCSISLPEGAFIPMGSSVSKTCIIGLRKKSVKEDYVSPAFAFLGVAKNIGFETGKKNYKKIGENDLIEFLNDFDNIYEEIRYTSSGAEYGWIPTSQISSRRLGASHLLNSLDVHNLEETISLTELVDIEQNKISIDPSKDYYYLEIPDISESTGVVTNIRKVSGSKINSNSLVEFFPGDILFSRINPRKNRITLIPNTIESENIKFVTSTEIYTLRLKDNLYFSELTKSALVPILRSPKVKQQIVRLGVGSSSSRARVYSDDLESVRIPILASEKIEYLSQLATENAKSIWNESQKYIDNYVEMQNILSYTESKDDYRTI